MNLYEVTNGWMGESYARAYVWASTERHALSIAQKAFEAHAKEGGKGTAFYENLNAEFLFSSSDAPFCTAPSGDGWGKKAYQELFTVLC